MMSTDFHNMLIVPIIFFFGINKQGKPENLNRSGRRRGVPNKFTELRRDLLETYHALGGGQWLVDFAKKYPKIFFKELADKIPMEIEQNSAHSPVEIAQMIVLINARLEAAKSCIDDDNYEIIPPAPAADSAAKLIEDTKKKAETDNKA